MSDLSLALTIKVVDEASAQLKKLNADFNKISNNWEKLGFAMGAALKVGVTAAIGGLTALTKNAIDNADEMGKLAQKAGITVEAFSGLAYAAKLSDVSNEQLKTGLKGLNESLVDSQDANSKAAKAFKYLSIETKNADGTLRKADDVFKEIADKFAKMPNGASKTALAMDLMKKSGNDLIPMLNSGAEGLEEMRIEAEKLGLVISKEQADQAEQFNDSITRMGNAASGVGLAIATELLPTLNQLSKEIIDTIKNGEGFKSFASGIGIVFRNVIKIVATAIQTFRALGMGLGAIFAAVAAAASGDFKGAVNILRMYKNDVNQMDADLVSFKKRIDDSADAQSESNEVTKQASTVTKEYTRETDKSIKETEKRNKLFADAKRDLQSQIDGTKNLTSVERTLWETQYGKYVTLLPAQKEELALLAKKADLTRQQRLYDTESVQAMAKAAAEVGLLNFTNDRAVEHFKNVVKYGSQQADTMSAISDKAAQLTLDIVQLQTELAILSQSDPGNTQGISDLQTRIKALQDTRDQLGDTDYLKNLTEAHATSSNIATNLSTWQTYIGGARDATKRLNQEEELLWSWLEKNVISVEEFNLAMASVDEKKFAALKEQLTEVEKKMLGMAENVEGIMGNFFYDAMQGQFDWTLSSFKRMLDQMVAEALAKNLAEAIFGANYSKSGNLSGVGGSFISGLFKMFGFRENGGDVTAGQPYIVGEKRAEVFIPKTNGTIIPSLQEAGGMMSSNNNIQLSVTAMDSQDVIRALDKIKRPLTEMIKGTSRTYNMG